MPKKTPMKAPSSAPRIFQGVPIPSGQQIFDALMKKIEPELVTTNLPKLDAPYKNETPEQKKARYKRYQKAFTQCRKEFQEWSKKLKKAVQAYKKALFSAAEKLAKTDEDNALSLIESQMKVA